LKQIAEAQAELVSKAAPSTKSGSTREFPVYLDYSDDVLDAVTAAVKDELSSALTIADKQQRENELDRVKALAVEKVGAEFEGREKEVSAAYRSLTKKLVRQRIVSEGVRIDGRGLKDIRELHAQVNVLPRVHGSS